ncbi:hypothetical protein V3C99_017901 [Haemonchus contortus]
MSGDPPESHFFSAEIDDDVSSGIADQEHLKTKFPSIVPDLIGISTDGPGVSTFNHAERTKLFNLFESIQSSTTSHNASEQDDDVPGQISVDLAGRAKPTIQEAANVNDDQLLSAVIETLYLLINAQRLCRKRKKLLLEMKVMRQDEVDMMKVIHADLPAHLQSVVRIEGDNVFINEAGFRCLPSSTTSAPFSRFPSSAVPHAMYLNPGTVPPVDMPPFIAAPCIPPIVPSKSTVSSMPPSTPSGSETSAAPLVVPPPAQPVSPDLSLGTELIRSSFMSSTYSHPSPISSGPNFSASLHIHPSSPAAVVTRLPDFSRPPPSIRPVSETSKCSLLKTTSSSVLTDVAVATNTESAPPAIAPTTVPPPNAALPLNMNVPPPNVHSGSGTFKAPYMQSPSFLGPLSGTSNTAHVQDFTKTITNMITSALKAPMDAGVNAFGARSRVRTYVGPGISLIGNFSPPLNAHDNDGSGEVDWTSGPRVFQYRSESCHDKRQGATNRMQQYQISCRFQKQCFCMNLFT